MARPRFPAVDAALQFFGFGESADVPRGVSHVEPIASLVAAVRNAVRGGHVDVRGAIAHLRSAGAALSPDERRAGVAARDARPDLQEDFREELVERFLLSFLLDDQEDWLRWLRSTRAALEREGELVKLNSLRNFVAQASETFPDLPQRAELEQVGAEAEASLVRATAPMVAPASRREQRGRRRRCVGLIAHVPASFAIASHTGLLVAELLGLAQAAPDLDVHLLVTGESSFPGPLLTRLPQVAADRTALLDRLRREAGDVFGRNLLVPEIPDMTRPDAFVALATLIRDLSPEVVLCWGGIFESRVWRRAAFESYPVVFVPFNHRNWVGPEADIVLSLERDAAAVRRKDPRARPYDFPVSLPPRLPAATFDAFARERPGSVVVVSALASGRFETAFETYDDATVDSLVGFLDEHPEVTWLFVGIVDERRMTARGRGVERLVAEGRIRLLGFQDDLRGVYAASDVYVHLPNFGGGGVGGLMAIDAGLPLVCFHDSDVAHYADAADVFTDLGAFFDRLAVLCADPQERTAHAVRQHRLATERHSASHSGPQLLRLCEEAIAVGGERLANERGRDERTSAAGGRVGGLLERLRSWAASRR
jgi:hypothetical protein